MAIKIDVFTAESSDAQHPEVAVEVPDEYKLLGGGAFDHWIGPGNLLTASYPLSSNVWRVAGKDHTDVEVARITGYAIAIFDPNDEWETMIVSNTGVTAAHPNATATLPPDFALTGGGAWVDYHGPGNLLTASYPSGAHTWQAQSKDHSNPDVATLWAFAIGLRRRSKTKLPEVHVAHETGEAASHPVASVSLPEGFVLCGGGALDHWIGAGNLLTASYPEGNGWNVAGKDHDVISPATVTAYAIGLKQE